MIVSIAFSRSNGEAKGDESAHEIGQQAFELVQQRRPPCFFSFMRSFDSFRDFLQFDLRNFSVPFFFAHAFSSTRARCAPSRVARLEKPEKTSKRYQ